MSRVCSRSADRSPWNARPVPALCPQAKPKASSCRDPTRSPINRSRPASHPKNPRTAPRRTRRALPARSLFRNRRGNRCTTRRPAPSCRGGPATPAAIPRACGAAALPDAARAVASRHSRSARSIASPHGAKRIREAGLRSPAGAAAALGGLFPLRQALGDDLRRFRRRLAHVRVFGDLALDPLALVLQEIAQNLQLGDELFDLQRRCSGNALDQRIEIAHSQFAAGLRLRLAQLRDVPANEFADLAFDLGRRSLPILVSSFDHGHDASPLRREQYLLGRVVNYGARIGRLGGAFLSVSEQNAEGPMSRRVRGQWRRAVRRLLAEITAVRTRSVRPGAPPCPAGRAPRAPAGPRERRD